MNHSIGLTSVYAPPEPARTCLTVAPQRWTRARVWVLCLLLGSGGVVFAQPVADKAPAQQPATQAPNEAEVKPNAPAKKKLRGALTTVVGWGPDYLGSSSGGLSYEPGFLLQYGRWSLSSNGSFAASADETEGEELPRGLGFNLIGDSQDWLRLSLRVDSGRRSEGISDLRGIDDVPRTVRMRLSGHINMLGKWTLTPAANIDLLGRGVGHTLELTLGRGWTLTPKARVDAHFGMTYGTREYLNSYFGISEAEARASGYAPYSPTAGLRDVRLGLGLHYDINPRWVATANVGVQHLVGPAADSPLARSTTHWGAGAGLGWRF